MKLSKIQRLFSQDYALLLQKAEELGYEVTLGEVYRDPEWQQVMVRRGKSKTLNSRHQKRLAADIFLWKDDNVTWDNADYEELGQWWESLSESHVWGGSWRMKDSVHFEIRP
jgi:peptidoglycan L-alanyl-D-glutamate endopeptidase CwlK